MEKLGIIVLNYNDYENTFRLVKEYEQMKSVDKIVVVDNQSPDNSFEKLLKLKSKKTDVIKTLKNKGYAAGNNFGIKYLNNNYENIDYIAISNPDIKVDEKAIKACVSYLENNKNTAICAPKMIMRDGVEHPISGWKLRTIKGDIRDSSLLLTRMINKPHIEMYDKDYMQQDEIEVDCVAGSFFIIKKEIFEKVDFFDENTFLYYEEDILGNKIKKLGYKNVILNKYNFIHYESVSVDKSMKAMKKFRNLQKSKIYYHKKYNEDANIFQIFMLYFFTFFRYVEQFFEVLKIIIRKFLKKLNDYILKFYKVIILILIILKTPIVKLFKRKNKTQKILYFSVVNWKWIKQRPHFVPLYLASNGYKVDYMYSEPYKKNIKEEKNIHVQNELNEPNLKIKVFKFFLFHLKRSILNRYIFVTRTLFMNYDKIIFTNPHQISNFFVRGLKKQGIEIYYECMDNYIFWENDYTIDLFNEREKWLVENALKIIVSSEGLKKRFIEKYNCNEKKIVLIRNGYDKEAFLNVLKSDLKLKHPCATYIGTIDEWFDFKAIINYANKYKDINFYIIGPVGEKALEAKEKIKNKNIIFIGPIEHKYVPDAILKSDVMLLPFLINELILDVDPVKLYEYLYMKKPIVSSYWKELDQFKGFVTFYKNDKDFEVALNEAFNSKIIENKKYEQLMFESSWSERLKKYLEAIK